MRGHASPHPAPVPSTLLALVQAAPAPAALLQAVPPPVPLLRLQAVLGIAVILGGGWLLSRDRRAVSWRLVLWGMGLQVAFAWVVLRTPLGVFFFEHLNALVRGVIGHGVEGGRFVFGNLVSDFVPVGTADPASGAFAPAPGTVAHTGAFFAFRVFPNIIFVSSLMAVLYHLGLMQRVVRGVAWVMQRTMRTSGAETLNVASNIFMGLTEAPLAVRPFVEGMTRSELMAVMTAGMATVSGAALAAYAALLLPHEPGAAGHLIAAAVMSAPATFILAKLLVPETETPATARSLETPMVERPDVNVIGAAARGAALGLRMALVVGAMLVAFIALVSLLNGLLGWVAGLAGLGAPTLEGMLGVALTPMAWLLGIPWGDAAAVGQLIGVEFVLNEFVAFVRLEAVLSSGAGLEGRSLVISIYALTSFANFGSVAMTLAALGEMAPSRRGDLARLGLPAMAAGLFATLLTAAIAGLLV